MEARLDVTNARIEEIYTEVSQAFEQARLATTDEERGALMFSPRMNRLEAERRVLVDEVFKLSGIDDLLA